MIRTIVFLLVSCIFLPVLAQDCDFDCTLKKHLDAIQNQDYEAFASTVTTGDSIMFILPNGKYFESTATFHELIKGWFAETGWHFNYKIMRKFVGTDLATALLLVSYDEDDRNGKPYHIDHFLNLVFQKENGEWRLVHDQNTKTELE